MPVAARSCECSRTICNALVISFSVSSVLPEDSLSIALRRGKQTEKAGADSGAVMSGKEDDDTTKQLSMPALSYFSSWLLATTLIVAGVTLK